MELIVIWLIMAGIGALIGSKKGLALTGFIWGLILGPIGWIIIAATKSKWICPACREAIMKDALKCKHCQTELSWSGDNAQIKDK